MRTLDERSRASRWTRDLRLLWRMAGMLFGYFTVGTRVRREYRRREARGETFWVDAEGPTRHREAALHRR